jgi:hypothetical protein
MKKKPEDTCVRTVPKICQEYRKPNELKNHRFPEVTPYILRFPFFLCFLHTVEVTGSNPVSPTISFQIP